MLTKRGLWLWAVAAAIVVLTTSCQAPNSDDEEPTKRRRVEGKSNPRGVKVTYFARARGVTYNRFIDTYLVIVSPTWASNHTHVDEPFRAIAQPRVEVSTEEHMANLVGFMRDNGFYSLRTVPMVDVDAIRRTTTSLKYIMLEEDGNIRIVTNEGLSPMQRQSFANIEAAICMAFNRAPGLAVEVQKTPVLDAFREFLQAEKEEAERKKREQEKSQQ